MARNANQDWQGWESEYREPETVAEMEAEEAYVTAPGPAEVFTEFHEPDCTCAWCLGGVV